MAFWTQEFMANRRKQWLDSLVKFEYQADGSWHEATIPKKSMERSLSWWLASRAHPQERRPSRPFA